MTLVLTLTLCVAFCPIHPFLRGRREASGMDSCMGIYDPQRHHAYGREVSLFSSPSPRRSHLHPLSSIHSPWFRDTHSLSFISIQFPHTHLPILQMLSHTHQPESLKPGIMAHPLAHSQTLLLLLTLLLLRVMSKHATSLPHAHPWPLLLLLLLLWRGGSRVRQEPVIA
jgi:hypothetical protein